MPTPRHIALLAALHTAHAQTAPEDSVGLVVQMGHKALDHYERV